MKFIPNPRLIGITYNVELIPNLRADMGCSGLATPTAANIKIDGGMCKDMINATEWHEFVEVCNSENQLGLTHQQIQSLATFVHQVINDNPEMFEND